MNTYQETLDWMFEQLPMYQNMGVGAYKKDLTNTLALCEHLHFPETQFKSIHVAGTNGKGSTSSMLASILQEAGYKVGLFTSPHLKDFRERIRINGEMITEEQVMDFIQTHQHFLRKLGLSFFEMTVGMAFDHFAQQKVDVAVIEVGLGGRLDATNVLQPLAAVITNIGLDHVALLGNTLPEIAAEKAGIIKAETPVIIGEYTSETKAVFEEKAAFLHAPIYFAQDIELHTLPSDLLGHYQQKNKRTVLATVQQLRKHFVITSKHERDGLQKVQENTGFSGRWQILNQQPFTVADTAHNAEGLQETMQQVHQMNFDQLYVVFGVVSDKDLATIVKLLPQDAYFFFAKPNVSRGLDAQLLYEKMKENGFQGEVCNSVSEAYQKAKNKATLKDLIYIGGSTFVVAEIL